MQFLKENHCFRYFLPFSGRKQNFAYTFHVKKKFKRKKIRPTDPSFPDRVTGNQAFFYLALSKEQVDTSQPVVSERDEIKKKLKF